MTDDEVSADEEDGAPKKGRWPTPRDKKDHSAVLRAEIATMLRDSGNAWTTAQDIVAALNSQARCRLPGGGAISEFHVRRQTRNYSSLFERQGCRVRLREAPRGEAEPAAAGNQNPEFEE